MQRWVRTPSRGAWMRAMRGGGTARGPANQRGNRSRSVPPPAQVVPDGCPPGDVPRSLPIPGGRGGNLPPATAHKPRPRVRGKHRDPRPVLARTAAARHDAIGPSGSHRGARVRAVYAMARRYPAPDEAVGRARNWSSSYARNWSFPVCQQAIPSSLDGHEPSAWREPYFAPKRSRRQRMELRQFVNRQELAEIVVAAAERLRSIAAHRSIDIARGRVDQISIIGDRARLIGAVSYLLKQAIVHSDPGTTIACDLIERERYALIRVIDPSSNRGTNRGALFDPHVPLPLSGEIPEAS